MKISQEKKKKKEIGEAGNQKRAPKWHAETVEPGREDVKTQSCQALADPGAWY